MRVTRNTNTNGTYRYEINGEIHIKASKIRYTHVSTFECEGEIAMFHKTLSTAEKNKGYAKHGWIKTGVVEIDDMDQDTAEPDPATTEAPVSVKVTTTLTAPGERAVKVNGEYIGLITREAEGWMSTKGRHAFRTYTQAAQYVAYSAGHTQTPSSAPNAAATTTVRSQDYCPRCSRLIALHADSTFYPHGPRAKRCTASGLEAKVRDATTPPPVVEPDAFDTFAKTYGTMFAKGTRVRVNRHYATDTYHRHEGKTVSKGLGDDGNVYITVDLDGFTWPFQADELNVIDGHTPVRRRVDNARGIRREITPDGWIVDMDHGSDVLGVASAWEILRD